MFKKILVPLDGTASAEKVGSWTVGFARAIGAEVVLLAVVDPDEIDLPEAVPNRDVTIPGAETDQDRPGGVGEADVIGDQVMGSAREVRTPVESSERPPDFGTQMIEQALEHARVYLQHESTRLEDSGVRVTTSVQFGDPAEVIVDQASELGADMIAMATHRGSALARGILGSVADRVLQSSKVPVLVAHPDENSGLTRSAGVPKTVIVPLDGSERSEQSVPIAIDIAGSCGSRMVFMRSVHVPYYAASADIGYRGEYELSGQRSDLMDEMKRFAEQALERGIGAEVRVHVGNPAERIIDETESNEAPLVVITSRGASGIKRWMMGSVTDKVIRSSGAPVLVIKSAD